jgi:hypothetical protein
MRAAPRTLRHEFRACESWFANGVAFTAPGSDLPPGTNVEIRPFHAPGTRREQEEKIMKFVASTESAVKANNIARSIVTNGLGLIPEIGGPLSAVVGAWWQEEADVWGSVRLRMEAIAEKKVLDHEFIVTSRRLDGIRNVIGEYTTAIKAQDWGGPSNAVGGRAYHLGGRRASFLGSAWERPGKAADGATDGQVRSALFHASA